MPGVRPPSWPGGTRTVCPAGTGNGARDPAARAMTGARPRLREAQVVDLLAALTGRRPRRRQPEGPEHRRVEGERPLEVTANEVEVSEPDQHAYVASPPSTTCREGVAAVFGGFVPREAP